jgi:predicted lipoprotein with Yx(FWY)xxD motif
MKILLLFISIYYLVKSSLTIRQARTGEMSLNQPNIKNLTTIQEINKTSPIYLVNEEGMALYMNSDAPIGESSCYGPCLEIFFPAVVQLNYNMTLGKDLDEEKLGYIKRDNIQQLAYNKHALFYFRNDTESGDTKGQGYNNTWFLLDEKGNSIKQTLNNTTITH